MQSFLILVMESVRSIEVEFESTEKDFQRVLLWYLWKRILLQTLLIIVLAVVFSYFLGVNVFDIKNNGWATLAFVLTITVLIILDLYRRVFSRAKKLKAIMKPAKTVFSEQGVASTTANASSNRDWANYIKIYETNKDFIFFSRKYFFSTIPKRFFKSQSEIVSLRELIKAKLGEKAKLQK